VSTPPGIGRLFGSVADRYDDLRPDYPDGVYDAIEAVMGSFDGLAVLDLAAGTGLQNRALARRGARLVAVDPDIGMLRRLRAKSPGVPAVVGRGEAIPLRDHSFDLVVCATAWHWLHAAEAVEEIRRLLRPGGHLALWWANNERDDDIEWEAAQGAVFDRWDSAQGSMPPTHDGVGPREAAADLRARGLDVVVDREFTWSRVVTREEHLKVLGTHSIQLALSEPDRRALLSEIDDALQPWPVITERLWGPLVVAGFPPPRTTMRGSSR
jgi:SAM-dependent methyltransferase